MKVLAALLWVLLAGCAVPQPSPPVPSQNTSITFDCPNPNGGQPVMCDDDTKAVVLDTSLARAGADEVAFTTATRTAALAWFDVRDDLQLP